MGKRRHLEQKTLIFSLLAAFYLLNGSRQPVEYPYAFKTRDLNVVWHPCSQMQDHEWLPLIPIKAGKGVWLEDFEGKRYLDAISSWWVNLFGHSHPYINARIHFPGDCVLRKP